MGEEKEAEVRKGSREGGAEMAGGRVQTSWLAQTAKFLAEVLIQSSRQMETGTQVVESVTLCA